MSPPRMAMAPQFLFGLYFATTVDIGSAARPNLFEKVGNSRNASFAENATSKVYYDDEFESSEGTEAEGTEEGVSSDEATIEFGMDEPTRAGDSNPRKTFSKQSSMGFSDRANFLNTAGLGLMDELDQLKNPLMQTDSIARQTIGQAHKWAAAPTKMEKRFHTVDEVAQETAVYLSKEHVRVKHDVAKPTQVALRSTKLPGSVHHRPSATSSALGEDGPPADERVQADARPQTVDFDADAEDEPRHSVSRHDVLVESDSDEDDFRHESAETVVIAGPSAEVVQQGVDNGQATQ